MRTAVLCALAFAGCGSDDTDGNPSDGSFADDDLDGYIASVDCDDHDAQVHPLADEVCNGINDDCDQEVDEEAVDGLVGFIDADRDGFGGDLPLVTCEEAGWSATTDDCDDTDPDLFPGAPEICNAVDDDCDLAIDEGAAIGAVRYDLIADAVSAAQDGDELVLCDGTIREGGIVVDRPLTISSLSGDPAHAVIDGSDSASSVFLVDGGALTLEGVTVKEGSGTSTMLVEGVPPSAAGGAINALTGDGGPVTVRNCVLSGNSARGGGAIAAGILTIEDSLVVGNGANGVTPGEGGAVWVAAGGSFTALRTLFEGNVASMGGALSVHAPTTLIEVEGSDNEALLGDGGFAIVRSLEGAPRATVTIEGGDFHDNVAANNAGVFLLSDADGTADTTTVFQLNNAIQGGALFLVSQIVGGPVQSWSGGTFTGNYGASAGGAIATEVGTAPAELSNVSVTQNTAGAQGGGLALRGGANGATTLSDSVVSGNQAFTGAGLYVLNNDEIPPMVLERVEITDNIAASTGGGVHVFFAEVDIVDSVISDNFASTNGGGLWMDSRPIVDITSTDFAGNVPDDVYLVESDAGLDLPDMDATLICTGADGTCS